MTLMDAQQYDDTRDRKRRNLIIAGVFAFLILAWVGYHLRNYPERHAVDKFLTALQSQDVQGAYALWVRDPDWKSHSAKYSNYTFGDFSTDWGPSGQWGIIKSHAIQDATLPSRRSGLRNLVGLGHGVRGVRDAG